MMKLSILFQAVGAPASIATGSKARGRGRTYPSILIPASRSKHLRTPWNAAETGLSYGCDDGHFDESDFDIDGAPLALEGDTDRRGIAGELDTVPFARDD